MQAQWNQPKNVGHVVKSSWSVFKCGYFIFFLHLFDIEPGHILMKTEREVHYSKIVNQSVTDEKIEMRKIVRATGKKERENYDHLYPNTQYVLLQFLHTHTCTDAHKPSHIVCLQTLCCNCSDIYICTWSLSASFHYLEADLERGSREWMPDDRNERGTKCIWKSNFELKPSPCSLSDRVTHRVSVLLRTARCTTRMNVQYRDNQVHVHVAWAYMFTTHTDFCVINVSLIIN